MTPQPPVHPTVTETSSLSVEDHQIWQAVVSDVRPLAPPSAVKPDGFLAVEAEPKTHFRVVSLLSLPAPPVRPALPRPLDPLDHGWAGNLDASLQDRFRKGKLPLEATLDLHGLSQEQAHAALLSFIPRCLRQKKRCVVIVTGKGRDGRGILRDQVPRWLNHSPLRENLLAFTYARPQHGGEGALYVLLKRLRNIREMP